MCLSSQLCDLSRVLVYKTLQRSFEGMLIPRNTFNHDFKKEKLS